MAFELPGDLCIAASARFLADLEGKAALTGLGKAKLIALEPEEDLRADVLAAAKVLVLEVDPSVPASVRRISKVRSEKEDLRIIAAIQDADVALVRTLVRQGIADVATLPFDADELAPQILEAIAPLRASRKDAALAPLTTVIRSSGGCGSTSVITHLAAALAELSDDKNSVCLADMDLQSGAVASFLGISSQTDITALLSDSSRVDEELLRSVMHVTPRGFSVITAPEDITPLDAVNIDDLSRLISLLRRRFGHVLVDLPADWTNWALSLATEATNVLLVTDISISGLRQAKRRIELLMSVGVSPDAIKVIANRMERRLFKTIGTDDIGEALHCDVAMALDDEGSALRSAQDQGLLIYDAAGKTHFGQQVRQLAAMLTGKDA